MNTIQYAGEWTIVGNIGHLFALVGLLASLFATLSFWQSARTDTPVSPTHSTPNSQSQVWLHWGRWGFILNVISVLAIGIILFYLIFNHRFEYKYVWQHSSLSLPVYYMISCFWEGARGQFLAMAVLDGGAGLSSDEHSRQVAKPCHDLCRANAVFFSRYAHRHLFFRLQSR
jgi:cytochrome c-type biogenesis protein CcmF